MLSLFTDVSNIIKILLVMAVAYLLGSLNIAIIVTKIFTGKDIRTMGSGNGGFTNVMRSVGVTAGIITFVGDFLKCVVSVLIGGFVLKTLHTSFFSQQELWKYGEYLAGMCCFLGHIYPVYFKFKGGKGVVTVAALAAVINFPVFLITFAAFAIVFVCTKIVSISSIISAFVLFASTALVLYFYNYKTVGNVSLEYVIAVSSATFVICAAVVVKHRANIGRLLRGEEKKLVLKMKDKTEA